MQADSPGAHVVTAPAAFYTGRHAELYDLFYRDKDYRAEAAFIHSLLRNLGSAPTSRLLELACGTGSHALEFHQLGYDVWALDSSISMVEVARRKARSAGAVGITFRCEDMRAFSVEDGAFDAAVCLFDSIGYVQTNESVFAVLERVQKSLRMGGLFIFEFWSAAALLRNYEPLRIRRWSLSDREVLRISETKLDFPSQVCEVSYSVYELFRNGTYSSFVEEQKNRYFLVQEMLFLLRSAGLTPLRCYAGFSLDEPLTEDTWHVVAVAQRSSANP